VGQILSGSAAVALVVLAAAVVLSLLAVVIGYFSSGFKDFFFKNMIGSALAAIRSKATEADQAERNAREHEERIRDAVAAINGSLARSSIPKDHESQEAYLARIESHVVAFAAIALLSSEFPDLAEHLDKIPDFLNGKVLGDPVKISRDLMQPILAGTRALTKPI